MYFHICSHDHKNAHKQEFTHAHNDLDNKYAHICIHTNIALFHIYAYAKRSSNACIYKYIIYEHRCTQTYTYISTHKFIQAH